MHRKLNVKNEDEVVDALMLWIRLSKVIEPIELVEVLKQVNWPYVSFDKMMELFKQNPLLRHNIHVKSLFSIEFRNRATKSTILQFYSCIYSFQPSDSASPSLLRLSHDRNHL